VFGWKRTAVTLGLAERRTGITCVGAQSAHSGRKPWEEKYPEAAEALRQLAEAHVQHRSTFNSTIGYTRVGATEAIAQLKVLEFPAITLCQHYGGGTWVHLIFAKRQGGQGGLRR